jgi:hypothetical protein
MYMVRELQDKFHDKDSDLLIYIFVFLTAILLNEKVISNISMFWSSFSLAFDFNSTRKYNNWTVLLRKRIYLNIWFQMQK